MKAEGKSRIKGFKVSKVLVELDGMLPIITADFILERDDGAIITGMSKRRPIPVFFDETAAASSDAGYFQKPVADALKLLLDALEVDTYPELFEGSPTDTQPAQEKAKAIPEDW